MRKGRRLAAPALTRNRRVRLKRRNREDQRVATVMEPLLACWKP